MKLLEKKIYKHQIKEKVPTHHLDASGRKISIGDMIIVVNYNMLFKGIVTRVSNASVFYKIIEGLNDHLETYIYDVNKGHFIPHKYNFIGNENYCITPYKRITII